MKLKDLRKEKGMNQKEAAIFLQIPLRTYQNYENDDRKIDSYKYKALYTKLASYNNNSLIINNDNEYLSNVITKDRLNLLINNIEHLYKRKELTSFLHTIYENNQDIIILKGLYGVGKTTLLLQAISSLNPNECAYIVLNAASSLNQIYHDLEILYLNNIKYVFIDNITLASDFINNSSFLSTIYLMYHQKIIITGDETLSLDFVYKNDLYQKSTIFDLNYLSYNDYQKLTGDNILNYLTNSFNHKMDNFEDIMYFLKQKVALNLQKSLENDKYNDAFLNLRRLYNKDQLIEAIIYCIIENITNRLIRSLQNKYPISQNINTTAISLNGFDNSSSSTNPLDTINLLIQVIKASLSKYKIDLTSDDRKLIIKYLIDASYFKNFPIRYKDNFTIDNYIEDIPFIFSAISNYIIKEALNNDYFSKINASDKIVLKQLINQEILRQALIDNLINTFSKSLSSNYQIFSFINNENSSCDIIIFDTNKAVYGIYNVDNTNIINPEKIFNYSDEFLNDLNNRFGKLDYKGVFYLGVDKKVGDINYHNIDNFLINK